MSLQKQIRQKVGDNLNLSSDSTDSTCVVCFRNVDIYSIGECDHPVCYECSTRMRVLCQQNECPICRQGLSKVIFTYEVKSYRELEAMNRSEHYNKKYKICFLNTQIQKAFYDLLDHACPQCNGQSFSSFETLKDHVRKEHKLFYCDICTVNLKIFSCERRCYNREELGRHRRKGDPDNTSHRGHPLCEYCDCRYLDRDELFRHLRREHYFCHFCDADGGNQYYGNIESLREHFRNEHYLCEEGDCAREQFTAVFRSDIDLRAHIANLHGKSMGKQQAKQARTLQLEITLGPRGRGQQGHSLSTPRSRNENDFSNEELISQPAPTNQNRTIDARNEQEFPSLAGTGSSSTNMSLVPATMSIRAKAFGPAGLARTKENFPALGNSGNSKTDAGPNIANSSKLGRPVSAILRNQNVPPSKTNNSMVIHVSNRPNNIGKQIANKNDFPALPGSSRIQSSINNTFSHSNSTVIQSSMNKPRSNVSNDTTKAQTKIPKEGKLAKRIDEDFLPGNASVDLSACSAKHRSLVDDYVSVAHSNSKLALIQKEEKVERRENVNNKVRLDAKDFPALATSAPAEPQWVKPQKQQDRENRKSKVAPPPVLCTNNDTSYSKKNQEKKEKKKNTEIDNQNNIQKDRKQNKNNEKKQNEVTKVEPSTAKVNESKPNNRQAKEKKVSDNNNEVKTTNKNKFKDRESNVISGNIQYDGIPVPPGFNSKTNEAKPMAPPGFKSVTLNSIAKPSNNMTFTNSLGENFSILPNHQYTSPPDSARRNQELVHHFQSALRSNEAVAEFRFISQKFREGLYKASAFFEHCQAALDDKFDDIFPELLVLLPDISKQQELYLVYSQYLNSLFATPKQVKVKAMLSVCKTCKQIIMSDDLMAHTLAHNLDNNFPTLNNSKTSSS